jgi:hypothetical protein
MNQRATVVALPGLLGFIPEEQRSVLTAVAGIDAGAPRTFEEAAEILEQDQAAIEYQAAMALRSVILGVATPDPDALRLLASFPVESVWADLSRPGIFALQGIVSALRVYTFPARFDFHVVNYWTGGWGDVTYYAGTRIIDEEGRTINEAETAFGGPGYGATHVQQFVFSGVWDRPGHYVLETWLNGLPLYAYYLPVYEVMEVEEEMEVAGEPG